MDKTEKLREIKDEVLANSELPLFEYRKKNHFFPVIGQGNHNAEIVFIGEAPGLEEAKKGRPFIGKSGKILDKLFEGAGIDRMDVYITNIVKDRPPNNRDPSDIEIKAYAPYLTRQLEIIQPRYIATLGRFSMDFIATRYGVADEIGKISETHGKVHDLEADFGAMKLIPLFHPAVATYNPMMFKGMLDDMRIVAEQMRK